MTFDYVPLKLFIVSEKKNKYAKSKDTSKNSNSFCETYKLFVKVSLLND